MRSDNKEVKSTTVGIERICQKLPSFRFLHFEAATRLRCLFLSSFMRSWLSISIGLICGLDGRSDCVCGSSLICISKFVFSTSAYVIPPPLMVFADMLGAAGLVLESLLCNVFRASSKPLA